MSLGNQTDRSQSHIWYLVVSPTLVSSVFLQLSDSPVTKSHDKCCFKMSVK